MDEREACAVASVVLSQCPARIATIRIEHDRNSHWLGKLRLSSH
jgi:hypothetical protein